MWENSIKKAAIPPGSRGAMAVREQKLPGRLPWVRWDERNSVGIRMIRPFLIQILHGRLLASVCDRQRRPTRTGSCPHD